MPIPRKSLYTGLVSNLLFPLQEMLKGHDSRARLRMLEASQWLPPEVIAERQLQTLRRFLIRAGDSVPYYRTLFREVGFAPDALASVTELAALPLLDKPTIRANVEALKADGHRPLQRFNTGGSSGEPLVFYLSNERVSHDVAAKWRATRWWGVDIGDPEIVVWGSPVELGAQDRLRVLRDRVMRTHLLPAFEMSKANLDSFVDQIDRIRPRMLFGYPSSIAHIARHAEQNGRDMAGLGIAVAFVTAERLYDNQREDIERVFGCPVANGYGARDAGFIAHACPDGGLHLSAEDIVLEIVDQDGMPLPPGQSGEIVVTNMATSDFPFIRYRTGDIGVLAHVPCPCGRGLPALAEVRGRSTDFVVAADGTIMHGLALIYVVRDVPGIETFKIIQESVSQTRLLLVTTEQFDESNIALIRQGLQQRLGTDVRINVERLDRIPREASGKHRYVVSRLGVTADTMPIRPGMNSA